MKERERKVKEFELYNRLFKTDTIQLEEAGTNSKRKGEELSAAREQLAISNQDAGAIQLSWEQIKNAYDSRDLLLRESEELGKLAQVRKLGVEQELFTRNAEVLKKQVEEITKLVTTGKKAQKEKATKLETMQKELPDTRMLSEMKAWFTEKNRLINAINEKKGKISENDEWCKNLNIQFREKLVLSGFFNSIPEQVDPNHFLNQIGEKIPEVERDLRASEKEIVHLETGHQLERYATELKEGKSCPLCGSKSHPNILKPKDNKRNLEKARESRRALEAQLKEYNELEKGLTVFKSRNETLLQNGLVLRKELSTLETAEKEHDKKFIWVDFDPADEGKLREEETRYEHLIASIETLRQEVKKIGEEIERNEQLSEIQKTESGKIDQQMTANQSRIELLRSQVSLIDVRQYSDLTAEQLNQKAEERAIQHKNIVQQFADADKKRNAILSSISSLTGKIESLEKDSRELQEQVEKLRRKIEAKLKENGGLELSHVLEALGRDFDLEAEETAIQEFYRNLEALRKYLDELDKQLAGRTYEEEAHLMFKKDILSLKLAIDEKNQEFGKLGKEIKTMKSNAKKFAELQVELNDILLREKDITELKNLFRSSGFVNYISTVYLQTLCQAANERFYKLTRQSLGLELAGDNSFLVRDYMNEGRLRSVKTLSGGQTFQASLSLALALADSIHKLAGSSENFFFLDEGFGTLDKETLEVAFDTLKALRKENRIVGVISHVDEMQAEIETYLKVTNDEENGSVVKASWEG